MKAKIQLLEITQAFREYCRECYEKASDHLTAVHTSALYECAYGTSLEGDRLAFWQLSASMKESDLETVDPAEMAVRVIECLVMGHSRLAHQIMNAITVQATVPRSRCTFVTINGKWWINAPLPKPRNDEGDPREYFGYLEGFYEAYQDWLKLC